MAMKAITGAFRTTPTAALQYETGLLPPELRLQHKILRSFTRMQTLPTSHPLQLWIQTARKAQNNPKQRYISNLENLAIKYPTQAAPVETIHPHIRPPWYTPKITSHIESTKDKAKEHHDKQLPKLRQEPNTICLYTDGSGINGNIGAAVYSSTVQVTKKRYIGKETESNVFAAELTAINLGLDILEDNIQYTKCEVFTDSQTSIKALLKPQKQSGQAIICSILDKIDELQTQRNEMNITLTWIPGHMDIEGNEQADKAAKEAANSTEREANAYYPALKSARNAANKQQTQNKWIKQWNEGTETAVKLRAMSKRPHFTSGGKLYSHITVKQQVAWLVRLRTAHCSLNKYLHQRGHEEEPLCACREEEETVEHYLLKCKRYTTQREKMVKEVGAGGMRIEKLVGNLKCIKYTMEYVKETNRFGF
jgi:ribonuclease HI